MSAPTPVDFRSALETYIAGHLSLAQLETALIEALRAEPHMEAAHHGLVAAYGRVGRRRGDRSGTSRGAGRWCRPRRA